MRSSHARWAVPGAGTAANGMPSAETGADKLALDPDS